ncbi:MAG: hypothetical protein Q7J08_06715 [Methanocorpusculum sp.]|uniref:hypothetical protein n=1 Tax=Methanocorpusculum sp. TaxID=2058474 RepID=UPI00271C17DE|nr:hypothetical protein [Methanocorpusculum sp.]MDO9523388.1 hypothetical protein [Methanocorpusculum sp.]
MSSEDTSPDHFSSINAQLDAAERYLHEGDIDASLSSIETAVSQLCCVGSGTLSEIPEADIATLDGRLAAILRRFAESSGVLPENFDQVLSITGVPESLRSVFAERSSDSLSAEEIVEVLQIIYTAPDEISEDPRDDISILKTLTDILIGQKTVSDVIFSENGGYDMLAVTATPYLITGAVYVYGDEGEAEAKIPDMLEGPVKRLVRLLFSLLTSAFISGLLLLIVRRILAARRMRPGVVENAAFAASVLSLTAANIPMILEGLRAAVHELEELRSLIITS